MKEIFAKRKFKLCVICGKQKRSEQKFRPFPFNLLFPIFPGQVLSKKNPGSFPGFDIFYTTPCANIASATFTKPAMFAPFT